MTDRETLLAAIKANPREDTPRLMYADWLDEHGAGDLDAATSEFVRVSCNMKNNNLMSRPAYKWIPHNWHRLVPSLASSWHPADVARDGQPKYIYPNGRRMWCHVGLNDIDGLTITSCSFGLELWKGFVTRCMRFYPRAAAPFLVAALGADQPLCRMPKSAERDPREIYQRWYS